MSKIVTRADAHLAGQLGIPVGEFHRIAFRIGADALRGRYEQRGEVKLPLRTVILVDDDSPTGDLNEKLPVFLPRGMVEMYRTILEEIAGVSDVSDYIETLTTWMLESAIDRPGFPEGIVDDVAKSYEFKDDAEREKIVSLMLEEVQRWQYVDGTFSRKEAAVAA